MEMRMKMSKEHTCDYNAGDTFCPVCKKEGYNQAIDDVEKIIDILKKEYICDDGGCDECGVAKLVIDKLKSEINKLRKKK